METQLTIENQRKLDMLIEAGVVEFSEGEWYIATKIDPYKQNPVTEEKVIAYVEGV